jgi:hypothetical protein
MRSALRLTLAAAVAAPALGLAQASVQLRLELPVVLPQLVVVAPGVQVVPEVEHEVFFSSGWYWVRQDGGWYRSHSPRGGWFYVQPERVPHRLVTLPPGKYRHWRRAAAPPPRPAPGWRPTAPAPRPQAAQWRGDDRGGAGPGHGDRGGHGRSDGGGDGRGDGDGHGGRKRHGGDRD